MIVELDEPMVVFVQAMVIEHCVVLFDKANPGLKPTIEQISRSPTELTLRSPFNVYEDGALLEQIHAVAYPLFALLSRQNEQKAGEAHSAR